MENTDFLTSQVMGTPVWLWAVFLAAVFALLAFDLGVLNRKDKEIGVRQSLWLSLFYISCSFLFGLWVWHQKGSDDAILFYTGYIIEWTLSLDNVFVIATILAYMKIPRAYQHRVLLYGILGVLILRGIMIGVGAALVSEFQWILYIFGAFLLFTGIKMLVTTEKEQTIEENFILRQLKKRMKVTSGLHGHKFFVHIPDPATGRTVRHATPLFIALVMVEFADLLFAVDSVPAIFAITTDAYLVYTSNIFAILGLRALYFALAAMIHRFALLKYALSAVLIFIGAKIIYAEITHEKVDPVLSLTVTILLIASGVIASLMRTRNAR